MLLDMIKESFRDNTKSENELIELYSNVDMIIIDDLGTERISQWTLEKLYTIVAAQIMGFKKIPCLIIDTTKERLLLRKNFKKSNLKDEKSETRTYRKMFNNCTRNYTIVHN